MLCCAHEESRLAPDDGDGVVPAERPYASVFLSSHDSSPLDTNMSAALIGLDPARSSAMWDRCFEASKDAGSGHEHNVRKV